MNGKTGRGWMNGKHQDLPPQEMSDYALQARLYTVNPDECAGCGLCAFGVEWAKRRAAAKAGQAKGGKPHEAQTAAPEGRPS